MAALVRNKETVTKALKAAVKRLLRSDSYFYESHPEFIAEDAAYNVWEKFWKPELKGLEKEAKAIIKAGKH